MSPPNRSGHRFPPCSTSPRPHALATAMTLSPRQRREAKSFSPTLLDTPLALCHPLCSACSSATANPTVPPRLPPTAAVATERLRLYQVCPVLEPHSAIVRSHRSEPTPIAFLGHEDLPAPALYAPSPASSPPPHQRPSSPPAHHLGTTSSVSPSLPTTPNGFPNHRSPFSAPPQPKRVVGLPEFWLAPPPRRHGANPYPPSPVSTNGPPARGSQANLFGPGLCQPI
jgi:hypothetical protein